MESKVSMFMKAFFFVLLNIIVIVNIGILCYTGISNNSEVFWIVVILALMGLAACLLS